MVKDPQDLPFYSLGGWGAAQENKQFTQGIREICAEIKHLQPDDSWMK